MSSPLSTFVRLILLVSILFLGSSCVHLKQTHRDFQVTEKFASTYYGDEITAEEALKRIPKDPDFKEIRFNRKLDRSLLQAPGGAYRVGPGDVLDIEIAEKAESRSLSRVMPDGMLYYDVAPGISAKGKTVKEISLELSNRLSDDYVDPIVTVNVSEAASQRFFMLGQVRTPGTFPITKPTTLIDAISQGGGLLSYPDSDEVSNPEAADLERAILIRNGNLVPVNFDRLISKGDMSHNVYVRGGDYIFVPSLTARSIYVLGSVNQPGPVFYEKGATMLSSVAAAGGPDVDAIVTKALVIRGGTHAPRVAVVNFRAIMKGAEPDLKVEGGDIIWLPKSPWSKLDEYVEEVLVTAAQAVAVQEGLGVLGGTGSAGVTISAGGN